MGIFQLLLTRSSMKLCSGAPLLVGRGEKESVGEAQMGGDKPWQTKNQQINHELRNEDGGVLMMQNTL